MQYIENDGHVTREYEVRINVEELENIIRELDTKCYRIVNKKNKVAAKNKEEAIEKVNMAINSAGIKVNGLVEISEGYKDLVDYPGSLLIFDCDCLCKSSSQLVYILERILEYYCSNLDFKDQNSRIIDLLIAYEYSDELKSYDERGIECQERIKYFSENNPNDLEGLYRLQKESNALLQEIRHNKNYDFDLLRDLYKKAKNCFELVLVSETIHYKDIDKNPKVYKLGTIKNI